MKMHKDFSKRMTALAEGIPREVVANLLERLMPRAPVSTRMALRPTEAPPTATAQPSAFRTEGKKRRMPKSTVMRRAIMLTGKGRSRLRNLRADDQLHRIAEGPTVRAVLNSNADIAYSDVTYAERVGYILFVEPEY